MPNLDSELLSADYVHLKPSFAEPNKDLDIFKMPIKQMTISWSEQGGCSDFESASEEEVMTQKDYYSIPLNIGFLGE